MLKEKKKKEIDLINKFSGYIRGEMRIAVSGPMELTHFCPLVFI